MRCQGTSAIDPWLFVGTAAFTGAAGELDYLFDSSRGVTVLQGDTNGDRVADFAIDLAGNITLSYSDLVWNLHHDGDRIQMDRPA